MASTEERPEGKAPVVWEAHGSVGVITFNRPNNRNSMTPEVLEAFTEASRWARTNSDLRALVITGTGSCFSAGADFKSNLQVGSETLLEHERSEAGLALLCFAIFASPTRRQSTARTSRGLACLQAWEFPTCCRASSEFHGPTNFSSRAGWCWAMKQNESAWSLKLVRRMRS